MSTGLSVYLLMAGQGVRFKGSHPETPKPLISYKGEPLLLHALKSLLPLKGLFDLHFVVCEGDPLKPQLKPYLDSPFGRAHLVILPERQNGPAKSASLAVQLAPPKSHLLFLDCDLSFTSADYFQHILKDIEGAGTGALCSFQSDQSRFSYLGTGADGFVKEVAEKKVISSQAIIGSYYLSQSARAVPFLESAQSKDSERSEVFMSDVIQDMMDSGVPFKAYNSDTYQSFGTPRELTSEELKTTDP